MVFGGKNQKRTAGLSISICQRLTGIGKTADMQSINARSVFSRSMQELNAICLMPLSCTIGTNLKTARTISPMCTLL